MGLPPEEHRPLRSGIEINSATPIDSATASYIDTGTLTGLAHDQNGQQVLVTCQHVMVGTEGGKYKERAVGTERMYQPFTEGLAVGAVGRGKRTSTGIRVAPISLDHDNYTDIAACPMKTTQPNPASAVYSLHEPDGHTQHNLWKIISGTLEPTMEMDTLFVLGAKFGQTFAEVVHVKISKTLQGATFPNTIELRATSDISRGDSGSGVFQHVGGGKFRLVGIVYGGIPGTRVVYAFPALAGERALDITFGEGPRAKAGDDRKVVAGTTVRLDGSASWHTVESNPPAVTYQWTEESGSGVTLTGANASIAAFEAPKGSPILKFKLRAKDAEQAWNEDTVTLTVVPAAPSGLTATQPSLASVPKGGQITFNWDDPADSSIVRYEYRLRGSSGSWPDEWKAISGSHFTFTITGLENGRTYFAQVRAVSSTGEGPGAIVGAFKPIVNPPSAPSNLSGAPGDQQITLSWDDPNDASITGYEYNLRQDGLAWGTWEDVPGSDKDTIEHTQRNLTNGISYSMKLRAVNAAGEGPETAAVSVTPVAPPAAPSNLSVDADDKQITLTWDDPSDASITGYEYRLNRQGATWPEEWVTAAGDAVPTRKITITGLRNGVAYNVRLRAINVAGSGPEAQIGPVTPEGDEEMGKSWIIDEYFRAGQTLHCGDVAVIKEQSGNPRVYKATAANKGRVIGIVHTPSGKAVGDRIATTGASPAQDQFVPIVVKGVAKTLTTGAIGLGDPVVATGTKTSAGSGKGDVATVESVGN